MKDRILIILFIVYIFGFGLFSLFDSHKEFSYTERRKLGSFPKVELTNKYIDKLDSYLVDQFPLRDEYRSIKAKYNYNILNMLVNNDIYIKDNYIYKSNYPTNYKSIDKFIDHVNKTKEYFKDSNIYMLVVPDKNYYLDSKDFLNIDYKYIYDKVYEIDNVNNIDIRNIMNIKDYYETDTHWKQENLSKVVNEVVTNMGMEYTYLKYKFNNYDKFYGVYYGESAINREPENIKYLTNDIINNVNVKYLENNKLNKVYSMDKLKGMDSYEVYLDGASSFIEIFNDNSITDKELIIFRDSFGSSISPLLIPYYNKITIIDNRYISSKYYLDKLIINDQDVLFLYSTLIVNDCFTLKN